MGWVGLIHQEQSTVAHEWEEDVGPGWVEDLEEKRGVWLERLTTHMMMMMILAAGRSQRITAKQGRRYSSNDCVVDWYMNLHLKCTSCVFTTTLLGKQPEQSGLRISPRKTATRGCAKLYQEFSLDLVEP